MHLERLTAPQSLAQVRESLGQSFLHFFITFKDSFNETEQIILNSYSQLIFKTKICDTVCANKSMKMNYKYSWGVSWKMHVYGSVKPFRGQVWLVLNSETVVKLSLLAFWLRSSVVSVLISLISGSTSLRSQQIKPIFGNGMGSRSLLPPVCGSAWYCITARIGPIKLQRKNGNRIGNTGVLWHRTSFLLIVYHVQDPVFVYMHQRGIFFLVNRTKPRFSGNWN